MVDTTQLPPSVTGGSGTDPGSGGRGLYNGQDQSDPSFPPAVTGGSGTDPGSGGRGTYDPNAPGGGTGGGQGGGTGGGAAGPPDWSTYLGMVGLTAADIDALNAIWTQDTAGGDTSNLLKDALAYIRGTAWYAAQYPGMAYALANGIIQPSPDTGDQEASYRIWVNKVQALYNQYGLTLTPGTIVNYLKNNQDIDYITNYLQGQAFEGTIADPLKGIFTQEELDAYSQYEGGNVTPLGERIAAEVQLYDQIGLTYQNFYGTAITRAQLDNAFTQGLTPQQIAQQFATQDAINAMNPQIAALFTPQEIQDIALEQAGGTTPDGQKLLSLFQTASGYISTANQYGQPLTRDQLNNLWATNVTPTQYGEQLQGNAWAEANKTPIETTEGAMGVGSNSQLSEQDLQTLGQQEAGYDTPQGQKLKLAFDQAQQRMQGAFQGVLARNSDWLTSMSRTDVRTKQQDTGA